MFLFVFLIYWLFFSLLEETKYDVLLQLCSEIALQRWPPNSSSSRPTFLQVLIRFSFSRASEGGDLDGQGDTITVRAEVFRKVEVQERKKKKMSEAVRFASYHLARPRFALFIYLFSFSHGDDSATWKRSGRLPSVMCNAPDLSALHDMIFRSLAFSDRVLLLMLSQ